MRYGPGSNGSAPTPEAIRNSWSREPEGRSPSPTSGPWPDCRGNVKSLSALLTFLNNRAENGRSAVGDKVPIADIGLKPIFPIGFTGWRRIV